MSLAKSRYLDLMAVGVSAACVIHCLALPFVFAALPFLGAFNEDPRVHQALACLAAPLGLFALIRSGGWRRGHLVVLALTGVALLAAAAFVPALEPYEVPMSVTGALLLAAMHLLNARKPHKHS